jgi:N-formylglutamate deformylase
VSQVRFGKIEKVPAASLMDPGAWHIERGDGPLVAAAIHDGHDVRPELVDFLVISQSDRRREEDPYTGAFTSVAPTRIVARRSRFEVDLNRPRAEAVYLRPEDAWGLAVWTRLPPAEVIERSRALYDGFYQEVGRVLAELTGRFGRVVVFDLHGYNVRRAGPNAPAAAADENPDVIVGTSNMDRRRWAPVVDGFTEAMRSFDFFGRRLDVRENVKFRGGYFPRWIHQTFPESACAIAIELKKFFMDEWSGEVDWVQLDAIRTALASAAESVLETLRRR